MMSSDTEVEEERFLDTCDGLSSLSVSDTESPEVCSSSCVANGDVGYEVWVNKPESVDERRKRFLRWMGLDVDFRSDRDDDEDPSHEKMDLKLGIDRLKDNGEAMLADLDSEQDFFSSCSLPCFWPSDANLGDDDGSEDVNPTWKIKNLDNGTEFVIYQPVKDGSLPALREVGSNKMISLDEFQKILGSSSLVREFLKKESTGFHLLDVKKREKSSWIQRFGSKIYVLDKAKSLLDKQNLISRKNGAVHVRISKKHSKELSSLYAGQQISAHEGSVLAMKFSPDGQYLASGGVDGVVRVWKILQIDITDKFCSQDIDPSCLYFTLDQCSKLSPLLVANDKSSPKITSQSCVVLPPKVFQLSEEPLHEFHGHHGEVLALSWSKNGSLLSSSVDKTARLWKVDNAGCQGVFAHNNYVTCIDFNPVNDNHFISGSIDGKVRIWEVESGRVIDWTDIREIVTAICYRPDGQGGIVGCMDGNCRFYDVTDNQLQLGAQVCLKGKRKLAGKRITGFQYCPRDTSKVMVSSSDSQVQVLCGTNIICKFKGNSRSSGSTMPASFTSDGEHIVSIGDDSNVHVWNYTSLDQKLSKPKSLWSRESFLSRNASVVVPWVGLKNRLGTLPGSILRNGQHFDERLFQKLPSTFPDCFGFFLDALYKGSATRAPLVFPRSDKAPACKSEMKLLKNSWLNALNSPHMWGLVIVTAGWDGCIRTFLNYGLPIRL